jgi:hypothetical protein
MYDDLLGYLLGALEPHEMRRVARRLRDDPAARDELDRIERALLPLEEAYEPVEPPPSDLVARTMAALPPLSPAESSAGETHAPATLAPMHSGIEPPSESTVSWMDWVSGSLAVAVLLGLLLPALAHGRFESRKVACRDQLRQFGTALTRFVTRNQQERLPEVSERGREAFAGVYAVRLYDVGLLDDPALRWCPSQNMPEVGPRDDDGENPQLVGVDNLVTVEQLHRASPEQLKEMQRWLGGHYAYTLGVIEQDRYSSPRFEARSSFAVMSDAPLQTITDGIGPGDRVGHSGVGINVLFEDGRVQFINLSSLDSLPDHPLLNHEGKSEAGVNVDDACLAPSWRAPFQHVRQR